MNRRGLIGFVLLIGLTACTVNAKLTMGVNLIRPNWIGHSDGLEYFSKQLTGKTKTPPDTNPWNPQFLKDMSIYHCIRFMDWFWIITINSVTWDTRTQQNSPDQDTIAYEWAVDLCNRENADFWLNVPHLADSTYVFNLGQLVGTLLKPNLKVYLEYANETWWENQCTGYSNCINDYVSGVGNSIPINSQLKDSTGKTVYGTTWWTGNCVCSSRMWKWFKVGWNAAGVDTNRIVTVLGAQTGYGNAEDVHYMLLALTNPLINPYGQKCDAVAEAPYWGDGPTGDPLTHMTDMQNVLQWTKPRGISIVCYEGGHGNDDPTERPEEYSQYTTYLNALDTVIDGPFCQFAQIGIAQGGVPSVQWGAKWQTSEPNDSAPIYRGLRDWSLGHPLSVSATKPYSAISPASHSVTSRNSYILYNLNGSVVGMNQRLRGSGCYIEVTPEHVARMVLNPQGESTFYQKGK